ncbi:MAG: hypothetical protein WAZ12_00575 [Candidatus Absconditicoccaceae bacterium]
MYIFSFNKFAGFDRVFKINITQNKEEQKQFIRGNLLKYQDDVFLCLGDEISFQEQYEYKYEINISNTSLISQSFLTDKTLDMVNWMVYRWYSSYKSVLKYFVSFDIEGLMNRGKIPSKKIKIKNNEIIIENGNIKISDNKINGQQLVIFPDLWTLFNSVDEDILSAKGNILLKSNDTQNQKDKKWRMIKNGCINNVFCTHGEIFQDRNDLKKIILIDPYKRYYENQQDPRYSVNDVVKKMEEIYGTKIGIG